MVSVSESAAVERPRGPENPIVAVLGTFIKKQGILLALIAIWAVMAFASEHFLTMTNIRNILLQTSALIIGSIGLTFVIITGGIDLSLDAIIALSGCVVASTLIVLKLHPLLGVVAGLAVGTLGGAISGFLVAKYGIAAFIATLVISNVFRGLALIMTEGQAIYGLPSVIVFLGQGSILGIPVPTVIAAAIFVLCNILLFRTAFGMNCFAVGGSPEAARLSGVNVGRIQMLALVLSGFLGSVVGLITTARLNAAHGMIASGDLLSYIAAVVIGGTSMAGGSGTLIGTLIGAVIIGTIRNGLNLLGVSSFWQLVALGVIVLSAVFIERVARGKSGA